MSGICFEKLGNCSEEISAAHPTQYQGHGQPRDRHLKHSRGFVSERMEMVDNGRLLIETSFSNENGKVPTAVRQVNSKQAPTPSSDRILDGMAGDTSSEGQE